MKSTGFKIVLSVIAVLTVLGILRYKPFGKGVWTSSV